MRLVIFDEPSLLKQRTIAFSLYFVPFQFHCTILTDSICRRQDEEVPNLKKNTSMWKMNISHTSLASSYCRLWAALYVIMITSAIHHSEIHLNFYFLISRHHSAVRVFCKFCPFEGKRKKWMCGLKHSLRVIKDH